MRSATLICSALVGRVFALMVCLAALSLPSALAQQYHIRHYTVDDGLPSARVRDITQDAMGRMWFATHSGIARYDGVEWSTYNVADGLTWADQCALRWDEDGGLWSVAMRAPFKVFHFVTAIDRWQELPASPPVALMARPTAFAVLGAEADRRLAIGTHSDGLHLGDGERWRRLGRRDGLPADEIRALLVRGDQLLVATPEGLVAVNADGSIDPAAGAGVPNARRSITGMAFEAAGEHLDGRLWLIGEDWIGYLEAGAVTLLATDLALPRPAAGLQVVPDRRGGLFFGSMGGLFAFHPEDGLEEIGLDQGLLGAKIKALFLDREDNLWVGGPRGVSKVISRRFAKHSRASGLLADEVTAVLERRDGTLVLGHPGGLSFLTNGAITTLAFETPPGSRVERVRDLAEGADGVLWIAADSLSLARYEGEALRWHGAAPGIADFVTAVHVDAANRLWVGTEQDLFQRLGDRFIPDETAPRHNIRRIFSRSSGALLLATDGGLYQRSDEGWHHWSCTMPASCSSTFAVLERSDDTLWVGTSAGLYCTDGDTLVTPPIDGPTIDRPIYFMVADQQERIWFGIDNGVLRFDGRKLEHFTVHDGLAGREANRAAGLVDRRGTVWIGTERGVTAYTEGRSGPPRGPPIVVLGDLETADLTLPLDTAQRLAHDENDVTFHFRAISLLDEERIQIQSWLEGFEPNWLPPYAAPTQEIRYTNLPPGNYRLHLRAQNAEGTWNAPVRSAIITIARPFWQRPWFFLLAGAVLLASLLGVQRHLAQRRYARRLENEVATRLAELRASEERYETIFRDSEAVKLIFDTKTQAILDANEAACAFYGQPLAVLTARTLADLRERHPTGGTPQPEPARNLEPYSIERHRLHDGTVRDVETYFTRTTFAGQPAIYAIVHDITQRRIAEEVMATEKERLAATLRNIADGVITTDEVGKILLINPSAEGITGWPAKEATAHSLDEIFQIFAIGGDGGPDARLHPLSDCTARARQPAILVRRNGTQRQVEVAMAPIRHDTAAVCGLVLAFQDVTEKQYIEQELAKTQKLEALGLLAGGIAHDFNNMLTVILGNLHLLAASNTTLASHEKFRCRAEIAALQARDLTRQLLTFSRGGAPIRRASSVTELVTDCASLVMRGTNVRHELDLPPDLWPAEIDAGQISQVVNNLLINAQQAMPEGGVVRIRGTNRRDVPASLPPGRYIAIEVADEGVGIAEDRLALIFDPYFSTKGEGRGLGLASAYAIAKRHDGLLAVRSQPSQGATFSLYLPASDKTVPMRPTLTAIKNGKGRVLIMDDEEPVRTVTGHMVEELGYRAAFAVDGEEAIDRYREALAHGEPFDLVLMDLTVPGGMGGQKTIRQLRAIDPEVQAVVMSGYADNPVMANHRTYGFQSKLSKPFSPDDLARVLAARARQAARRPALRSTLRPDGP